MKADKPVKDKGWLYIAFNRIALCELHDNTIPLFLVTITGAGNPTTAVSQLSSKKGKV
jgi:hypothetical protein